MFSRIKMEEFMESEHSDVFRVELFTKNIVLGSSGTNSMHMRVKRLQFFFSFLFLFWNIVCSLQWKLSIWNIVMKSNASCNEFKSNKVICRMCLVQRKIRQGRRKNKTKKKMVEADMEIASLNKKKTVVRVG